METRFLLVLKHQYATVVTEDLLHSRKQWLVLRLAEIDPEYVCVQVYCWKLIHNQVWLTSGVMHVTDAVSTH